MAHEIENKVRAALGVRELPALSTDAPAPKLKAVD
jgi:recombination protein RecA